MAELAFVPDFPEDEYVQRLDRAQRAMAAANMDAVLITTEAELRYFSGFRTLFWQSPTRPWFLIVPQRGKPVAVIPEIGAALMRATWLDDVRTWSAPHATDDGIALLVEALSGFGRLGMSMARAFKSHVTRIDRVHEWISGFLPEE